MLAVESIDLYYGAAQALRSVSLNAKPGDFSVPKDDGIIVATLICENGQVVPRKS